MQDALTLFYSIYSAFIGFIFDMQIVEGVSVGWVLISVVIIYFVLHNLKLGNFSSGSGGDENE